MTRRSSGSNCGSRTPRFTCAGLVCNRPTSSGVLMPTGSVNRVPEALLPLRVRTPTGLVRDLEALIDTGFTGSLALPVALVAVLGLSPSRPVLVRLGDGSLRRVPRYH